jgi:hypothetical protein
MLCECRGNSTFIAAPVAGPLRAASGTALISHTGCRDDAKPRASRAPRSALRAAVLSSWYECHHSVDDAYCYLHRLLHKYMFCNLLRLHVGNLSVDVSLTESWGIRAPVQLLHIIYSRIQCTD